MVASSAKEGLYEGVGESNSDSLSKARDIVALIPDPEIPAVTLADLGILRSVKSDGDCIVVTLTPTYSGCPATEAIQHDVRLALQNAGFPNAKVRITLTPAWSSDWISEAGREKLRAYGITPPACGASPSQPDAAITLNFSPPSAGIACPRCASHHTERLSQFGSTPCKALYRCISCKEPFDYFKPY